MAWTFPQGWPAGTNVRMQSRRAGEVCTVLAFRPQVDQLMAKYGIGKLDILSIDTEGWDAPVLRGAIGALRAKLVRVLEFEYHNEHKWPTTEQLQDAVSLLESVGYYCFWQSNGGELAALRPWCPGFEFRQWSNLVCAHELGDVAALQSMSIA